MRYHRKFVVEVQPPDAPGTWCSVREFQGEKARHRAHTYALSRTESEKAQHRVTQAQVLAIFKPKESR